MELEWVWVLPRTAGKGGDMIKDATIAPKERVNIVYRPAEGEGREEVELPMKLLVIGDFTGSRDRRAMEKREPVAITKANFDEVMQGQNISLNLAVPNRLVDRADQELGVTLEVTALRDFGPESVLEQVPELMRLLQLREALRALKGPLANLPDFGRKIHELVTDNEMRAKLLAEISQQQSERRSP